MGNPTPNEVNARSAPKAEPEKAAQKAPEPARTSAPAKAEAEAKSERYHVLKAITLADGRTVMPGEEFTPDDTFPSRRAKQLVDQKFLRPIE